MERSSASLVSIFNSVQSLSRVWLFATPWTAARPASLSITNYCSLLKLMSIESLVPSNHLILCRPLLLPSSIIRAVCSVRIIQINLIDVCVCVCKSMCVCTHMNVLIWVCTSVWMCVVSVHECVDVSLAVCFSLWSCVFVHECVSVNVCGCGSVVIYECASVNRWACGVCESCAHYVVCSGVPMLGSVPCLFM